ncbi:cell wall transcription factor ACE2 isoform X1 [Lucilia sericata]|uniref:cell wall transcription factor ACE2 isoform X1 n=2 Tax=Lucilia sericata TaxID=13632 RepID=UPI0018A8778A|nr:cell wall transcription factor ACE2 isoform X1 [Lucilia sericata]
MKSSLVTLAILMAVASADVSHLSSHYLPPNYQQYHQHHHHPEGLQMSIHHNSRPSNERVETTIEKHEVIELPTQIEIIKEGQPIYGVQSQSVDVKMLSKNNEHVPEIRTRYLPPTQEIENLQPPQVPYEMPMRTYFPPVMKEITTTDVTPTTTTLPPTTTNSPSLEEETTTEQQYTTEQNINNYSMTTTEMPAQEQESFETTTSPPESETVPENRYLPPMQMMPQNQYLPPLGMMLPPPEPMPQLTYQEYQEQLMQEQHKQQMYREQEMQEMMDAISEMEQQQMIALDPQQQPIAPVEPAHVLREDGYHYKTSDDDLRRYRYRH